MKIKFGSFISEVCFGKASYQSEFVSKDGLAIDLITIQTKDKHWEMTACHELGHAYSARRYIDTCKQDEAYNRMCIELIAWRIAKSFCKPKYWDDKFAIECLKKYAIHFDIYDKIQWNKLKIIPLNKGIRL